MATASALRQALTPDLSTDARPTDPETAQYVRSFLITRVFVGVLGIALPIVVVFADAGGFGGSPFPRDSLSAYYYSAMREVLVGGLIAIGVFLMAYKAAERSLDNTTTMVAGVAVVVVALLPTGPPADGTVARLTELQRSWGAEDVARLHTYAAILFIAALAGMSVLYGVREGTRRQVGKRSPRFWRGFHWACALLIALAGVLALALRATWPEAVLTGEWLAVTAFGVSWLAKGAEIAAWRQHAERSAVVSLLEQAAFGAGVLAILAGVGVAIIGAAIAAVALLAVGAACLAWLATRGA